MKIFGFKFSMNRMGNSQFDKINYTHVYPIRCNGEVFSI